MEIIKDLPEIFDEFEDKKKQSFLKVKEYKEKQIPIIGAYCSFFPREIAVAMGAIPVGLCSSANETVELAETVLPKNVCPLIKSSYGYAISDRCPYFHFADLVVGETTCDGKKKMYELMSEFKEVYVMELPNTQSEGGLRFWREEIIRFKEFLEEYEKGRQLEKRPRILITGCPMGEDTNKIVEAIENNGGVVVGFENCTGAKAVERMVDEDDPDVYGAIARKYFSIGCAIMTPNNNRIHLLGEMIDDYHVDGVVEMILSGCHSVEMESISVKNFVNEEKHLPYLAVVTDYSKGDVGQLNTRLAAFVEMIRK